MRSKSIHQDPENWDFPGGPLARTPNSQCRGGGWFHPWSGNKILHMLQLKILRATSKIQHSQINILQKDTDNFSCVLSDHVLKDAFSPTHLGLPSPPQDSLCPAPCTARQAAPQNTLALSFPIPIQQPQEWAGPGGSGKRGGAGDVPGRERSHGFEAVGVADHLVQRVDDLAELGPVVAVLLPAVQHELVQRARAVHGRW